MFKSFKIVELKDLSNPKVAKFVKTYHYTKSLSRGNKRVYALVIDNKLKGIAEFGQPVSKKYNNSHIELKRFCLAPNAPKNTASWFMSKCIRLLKTTEYKTILTYADPQQGHEGIIYKASNFKYLGKQKYPTMVKVVNGHKFHGRSKTARLLKGTWKALPKKHVFEYKLK